jgi:predicted metal-dependent peptidase
MNNILQHRFKKGENKKFTDLIIMMLSSNTLPYYAEFNTFINFYKSESISTCGVNISKEGMNFYWNEKFVNSLIDNEALFILIHEDCHLLFDHSRRSIMYNKDFSNIVQDMIINYIIVSEIMTHQKTKGKISIPVDHNLYLVDKNGSFILDDNGEKIKNPTYNQNTALFPPKEYTGELIFENLYEWMKDDYYKYKENKNNSDKSSVENKPRYGKYGIDNIECVSKESIYDSIDRGEQITLDTHIDDDVPESARKSIVNDFMQRLKNRGLCTGDIQKILDKLRKSKYNYLKDIKRSLTHYIFGTSKMKSIIKPNRRNIEGIKGKKKYKNVINCILDVSGSMDGIFEHVLSYIFQNDVHINLILNDTEVKAVYSIKNKRDLQNIKIVGLGGTTIQPAINYINDPIHKLNLYNTVILTDGYTDTLNFNESKKKFLILSTSKVPPMVDNKSLSKTILIDKENSMH